jgi:hypothetical protein
MLLQPVKALKTLLQTGIPQALVMNLWKDMVGGEEGLVLRCEVTLVLTDQTRDNIYKVEVAE